MKRISLCMEIVLMLFLMLLLMTGCSLLDTIFPDSEPAVPALVMEADVDAVLVVGDPDQIAWSIENVGTLDIPAYIITFDVLYPDVVKDNVIFTIQGYALAVDEKDEGVLDLVSYADKDPEAVSVSWELFD